MKAIIIIALCITSKLYAAPACKTNVDTKITEERKDMNTQMPKALKGATVCVKQVDGKENCMAAEKFKIVPRKQQLVVTKIKEVDTIHCEPQIVEHEVVREVKVEPRKNRISLHVGEGPKDSLNRDNYPTQVLVETQAGLAAGAQYQRLITERLSLGAQLYTNKSMFIGVGLDF
jgi:hypothetical protein